MSRIFKKPQRLNSGDCVGIVSPSSTIKNFPRRTERGVKNLEKINLKVIFSDHARDSFGHNAGTPQERADDINSLFSNPDVKAILCSTGGLNANAVIPLLDYDLIKANPKIFCGYSDITVLNNAITHKTGMVTFNGPTLLPTFGEPDDIHEYTLKYFNKAVFSNLPIGKIESSIDFSDENLWWETKDIRRGLLKPANPMYTIHKGNASGFLLGGNLNSLCFLGGTEYLPDFSDSVLFLEDEGEDTAQTERRLHYLDQIGVLKKVNGILFARPYQFVTSSLERTLDDILLFFGEKYDIPVIGNVDCGHTTPMATLPLGVNLEMNALLKQPEIVITEASVT